MESKRISATLAERMAAVPLGWPSPNLTAQPETFVKKLITDLHGPILDYAAAACEVAKRLYNIDLDVNKLRYYNMAYDASFPLSPAEFNRVFEVVARLSKGGYGDLPVREGVVEQLKAIKAAGIPIEIWTWVPGATEHNKDTKKAFGTGIAQSATYDLIRSLGIVDNVQRRVRFISPSSKASTMAEEHLPLIIEDNPTTAVEVAYSYGSAAILTPEPYNDKLVCPGVLRLSSMNELAAVVIDFFEKLEKAGAIAVGMR